MTSGWVSSHCPEEWVSLSRWLLTGLLESHRRHSLNSMSLNASVSRRESRLRGHWIFFSFRSPHLFPIFRTLFFVFVCLIITTAPLCMCWKKIKILSPLFVFWQKKSFHGSAAPSTCLKMGALDLETAMMHKHPLWHHQGQIQYLHFFWSELKTTRGWLTDIALKS